MMDKPKIINLAKVSDPRGNLSVIEEFKDIPFKIERTYWIYDVPGGEARGGHAYRDNQEFIVAMSGSFDVLVDDGNKQYHFSLNRSYKGVYIPAGTWRTITNYSTNAVAVIAASTHYDPQDAIRDYGEFKVWATLPHAMPNESKCDVCASPQGKYSVYDCGIITLDRHHSQRKGDISVIENGETVPFDVKRIYYLYDVPGGVSRGGHAHKELYQLIIAASGSFAVTLNDGNVKRTFVLNRPYQGLLVKPGIWRTLDDFSSGSVCLVLASEKYDAADYIREYAEFEAYRLSK